MYCANQGVEYTITLCVLLLILPLRNGLVIWAFVIMFIAPKISFQLMLIAASIPVLPKLMIALFSHLHVIHHPSNEGCSIC